MQPRLGEILCADHGLAPSALDLALRRAQSKRSRLGTALRELRLVDDDQLAAALARQHNVPAVRDKHFATIAEETRGLVPADVARRHGAVPIGIVNGGAELVIAMKDPGDAIARQALAVAAGYAIRPAAASESRIARALDQLYGPTTTTPPPAAVTPTLLIRRDPYFTPSPPRPTAPRPAAEPAAPPRALATNLLWFALVLTITLSYSVLFARVLDRL